jgi:hypothetical protein
VGTNSPVSDWTDLEEDFFAAAPPEVAVPPPPAASFDDLAPIRPERRASPRPRGRAAARLGERTETKPRTRGPKESVSFHAGALSFLTGALSFFIGAGGFFRRFVQKAWSIAQPASARAWRWTLARARSGARALGPALATTRTRSKQALRVLAARVANDLPEVPDGKTMLAAMAALIIVLGLSASVLGSRLVHPLAPPVAAPETAPAAP